MGHGFRTTGDKVGWKNDIQGRERAYAAQDWVHLSEKIMQAAERLRGVQIENKAAVELIQRFNYPNVLVYADPPYVLSTRNGKQYRHEMDNAAHADLLEALLAHEGPVILSGYDNPLYQEMLKDWHQEQKESRTQSLMIKTETLWMNFEPERQMNLFN